MTKKIDCRTLQCPAPVLKIKNYLEQKAATQIDIIVDNDAAVENVTRFLDSQGFEVSVDSDGIVSTISGLRDLKKAKKIKRHSQSEKLNGQSGHQKILLIISSEKMGKGNDELGQSLMINFIKTLNKMGDDLWRIIFINHGVKFSITDSLIFEELSLLEKSGIDILVCGACLNHLGLLDKKEVGQTTDMLNIVTSMQLADKVIHL